jgi:hypothetical protein
MSLYPNKKQIPQQMKISLALTTGFWNELYFYRAKFIITEWILFELYTSIFRAKNENKVLLGLRVKGEGLRRDFTHFSFHFLFHSIFQSIDLS